MSRTMTKNFSANEKEIAALIEENVSWKNLLSDASQEIHFIGTFLKADIFQKNVPNLYEKLQEFSVELENFRSASLDLTMEIHNNRYDIEGMRECEDIGCEKFYHHEHIKLRSKIEEYLEGFKKFRLQVFTYTSGLLKKSNNNK